MAEDKKDINSVIAVKNLTQSYIRKGFDLDKISKIIISQINESGDLDPDIVREVVEDVCLREYPNYHLIQKIVRSKLIDDIESDRKSYYVLDEDKQDIITVSNQTLFSIFDKKYSFKDKIYSAKLSYRPDLYEFLTLDENGFWIFNTFKPPFWMKDYYYSSKKIEIPRLEKIPEMYDKFLRHLVNDDEGSYNYILNWLANAIVKRNYCILCTIGAKGIGKGVLGSIMAELVGRHNFSDTGKRAISSNFNSQMLDKRIVYLDELKVSDSEQENRLKLLINDHLEVEQKGVDAKNIKNFASIYLSSNDLDGIKLSGDQRRFSIVNLTDKNILNIMKSSEIEALLYPENIEKLGQYLFYREFDRDEMMRVYTTERTEEVRMYSLNTWQDWLLNEYAPDNYNKVFEVSEITSLVEDNFGSKNRPGRPALISLQNRFPESLKVSNVMFKGKQKWTVTFKEPENAKVQVRK